MPLSLSLNTLTSQNLIKNPRSLNRTDVEGVKMRISLRGIMGKNGRSISCVVDDFLVKCEFEGLAGNTIKDHQRKLGRLVSYCGGCSINEVSPVVIREFLSDVQGKYRLELITVQRHLVSVKAFFHWVMDEGFLSSDPTRMVKVGRLPRKVVRGLSSEEVKVLLGRLPCGNCQVERRNRAIVYILVDCGLRLSELVNLRLSDVDVRSGVIRVMGKGSKERLVRMGLSTQKVLWEYMEFRDSVIEWLWLNDDKEKLTRSGVQQWLREFGRELGMRLYPHLLRHTFAISFLRNGANVFECQYALGHSSLEMTRRYCQALGFEDVFKRHEVASPIDNVLKG